MAKKKKSDNYLENFDDIVNGRKWSEGMTSYREGRQEHPFEPDFSKRDYKKILRSPENKRNLWAEENLDHLNQLRRLKKSKDTKLRAKFKARADKILEYAKGIDSIDHAVHAFEIYETLGIGDKPSTKKKIVNFAEDYSQGNDSPKSNLRSDLSPLRKFLKSSGRNSLESNALAVVGGFGVVASFFFLSITVTGNAIGSMNSGTSFSIGGILFILGLIGLFVSCKRK